MKLIAPPPIPLRLPQELFTFMFQHAERKAPGECCGMLGGKKGTVLQVYPTENTEEHDHLYTVDPTEAFKIIKKMRDNGHELIASYHSHVHSIAYPSAIDIDKATDSEMLYVIVSLANPEIVNARAYRIINKEVFETTIYLI